MTVTLPEFEQPVIEIVSVRLYVVVTAGETVGFANVEENPGGTEVHIYVLPSTGNVPI